MTTSPNSPPAIDNASLQEVLLQIQNVQLAVLFGSVAKETANSDSDLDIAVLADHKLSSDEKIQLIQGLAEKIGRPVDLIDLLIRRNPYSGKLSNLGARYLERMNHLQNWLIAIWWIKLTLCPYAPAHCWKEETHG